MTCVKSSQSNLQICFSQSWVGFCLDGVCQVDGELLTLQRVMDWSNILIHDAVMNVEVRSHVGYVTLSCYMEVSVSFSYQLLMNVVLHECGDVM